MKTITVEITGTTPLLMNKYNIDEWFERQKGKRVNKVYDPLEEAERSAYFTTSGKKELMIPSYALYASILNASSFHKVGKRSATAILAGSIRIEPFEISLGTIKYEVDSRPVVIQRARVVKSRARVDKWKAQFTIVYNDKMIADPQIIKTVLEEAGMRIGLLDFRPQRRGQYGTFTVTKFA